MMTEIKIQPVTLRRTIRAIRLYWKHCSHWHGGLFARIRVTLRFARDLRRYEEHKLDSESLFRARR
jgi:hypothetical protein